MATSPLDFLQLVADPLRWQLLDELGRSDRRVGELCDLVGKPQSLVSYHLRELRSGELVTARRSAADGRDTYYRANLDRFAALLGLTGAALHPAVRSTVHVDTPPARRGRKPKVLFLCTGNSARSQIAEALLEQRTNGAVSARSAGSHPKPLHPSAVRVMAERGIDISGNRSKHLDGFTGATWDRVITLCDKVREVCPDFDAPAAATAHWSVADPAAAGPDDDASYPAFVAIADELELRVGLLIAQMTSEQQNQRSHS